MNSPGEMVRSTPTCLVTFVNFHTKATNDNKDEEEPCYKGTRSLTDEERKENKILISEKEVLYHMEKFSDVKKGAALLCAALLWQEMEWHYLGEDKISTVGKIIEDIGDGSLGLIGPDEGPMTRFLEYCWGRNQVFRCHALAHDVAGRFRLMHNIGPGYLYVKRPKENEWWITRKWRGSSLAGQITGLCHAWWNKNDFVKMISIQM